MDGGRSSLGEGPFAVLLVVGQTREEMESWSGPARRVAVICILVFVEGISAELCVSAAGESARENCKVVWAMRLSVLFLLLLAAGMRQ